MDKTGSTIYRPAMLRLLVPIVTAFLLALVSFTASAHETGMAVSTSFASPMPSMDHASMQTTSCADTMTCGNVDPGLCDLVCTGVGVFLPPARLGAGVQAARETYLPGPETALVATPPGLDDRPPIAHLP